ncbi:hypothetical protein [Mesobacterium pallidum]|uniref:hypothetical protein n=1 Tax=Mesobacterium pallidum TaxID=2872037 RepID=UPI001EE1D80D|nr:hypothetical protein [Mesobacterium pallidum]
MRISVIRRPAIGALVLALGLSGCGYIRDSAINPANWFGRGQVTEVDGEARNPLLPRLGAFSRRDEVYPGNAIAQITDMGIDRLPGGAVVRVTGVSDRQGPYDARIVQDEEASSADTLVYTFEVVTPRRAPATGSVASRTVTAALYLDLEALEGVRRVTVRGRGNEASARR